MINRVIKVLESRSFFLFGARGTGKTTLLKEIFKAGKNAVWFDLLDPDIEAQLQLRPSELLNLIEPYRAQGGIQWIVIDEIQKAPSLLDVVHKEIENKRFRFALTGSSARKLKRGAANLLAGRALQNYLFPITSAELGNALDLDFVLRWGSLPEVFSLDELTRKEYLKSYVNTYLREEIQIEQLVRKVRPFRSFLEIAAQSSGKIVNYSHIARDIRSDPVSVKNYFDILEDTLVGTLLPSFHQSIRKRQRKNPKFYFFDTGVKRAVQNLLDIPIEPRSSSYGNAFEHWLILEFFRLNHYYRKNVQFSYLRTKDDVEIDLIIEKPNEKPILIEIKSSSHIHQDDIASFIQISKDLPNAGCFCLSNDPQRKKFNHIECLPWRDGLTELM